MLDYIPPIDKLTISHIFAGQTSPKEMVQYIILKQMSNSSSHILFQMLVTVKSKDEKIEDAGSNP